MQNPRHVPLQHPSTDDIVLSDRVVTLVTRWYGQSSLVDYGVEPTGPNGTRTIEAGDLHDSLYRYIAARGLQHLLLSELG